MPKRRQRTSARQGKRCAIAVGRRSRLMTLSAASRRASRYTDSSNPCAGARDEVQDGGAWPSLSACATRAAPQISACRSRFSDRSRRTESQSGWSSQPDRYCCSASLPIPASGPAVRQSRVGTGPAPDADQRPAAGRRSQRRHAAAGISAVPRQIKDDQLRRP